VKKEGIMIYPMRVYNKNGNLVKLVTSEVLKKSFWDNFWDKENLKAYNKKKNQTKAKETKPLVKAAQKLSPRK
jgi:hypothetical protein